MPIALTKKCLVKKLLKLPLDDENPIVARLSESSIGGDAIEGDAMIDVFICFKHYFASR